MEIKLRVVYDSEKTEGYERCFVVAVNQSMPIEEIFALVQSTLHCEIRASKIVNNSPPDFIIDDNQLIAPDEHSIGATIGTPIGYFSKDYF